MWVVGGGGTRNSTNYCGREHGTARRMWHSAKVEFLSVLVWELSFSTRLSWVTWLHHLSLILGVVFATDHNLRQAFTTNVDRDDTINKNLDPGPTAAGETLDGFACVTILRGCMRPCDL